MKYIEALANIQKEDVAHVGGKGASLGEMAAAGIPVPDGFVILTDAFEGFIHEAQLAPEIETVLKSVDITVMHTIENASEQLQALILAAPMSDGLQREIQQVFEELKAEYVAVRSSATAEDGATAAWAGQLDTFLNTTRDTLLENIKKCWASLFTPRALFYRFEKGLHNQHISVAVVVQKMVQSEVSGIAFSVHPVTEDRNQMIIEAGLGLGEAIVSGQITPDSYVVEKQPRGIIDKNVQTQIKGLYRAGAGNEWKELGEKGAEQKLSDTQIIELSKLVMNIETHYGFPVDVEWACEGGKFFITQSRPITTLHEAVHEDQKSQKIRFVKTYSRDYSMIVEQAWYSFLEYGLKKLGWDCPYEEFVIFYINDGVIEIWENEVATEWVIDQLLEKNKKNSVFFDKIIEHYKQQLQVLQAYWEKGSAGTKEELSTMINVVFESMVGFFVMYFSSIDERTPEHVRTSANVLRDADTYFGNNSKYIRQSLIALYPELEGYEAGILKEEIYSQPDKEALSQRKKHGVIYHGSVVEAMPLWEFLKKHPEFDFVIETPPEQGDILKGSTGSKGNATGIVRIVRRIDQIKTFCSGEILVSLMTTPDFLPAMHKAAAIITDEGGIMCHAAIVARELKKPCIIGTKFATEVLKDGDVVEVDADNGVVRIMKRNE